MRYPRLLLVMVVLALAVMTGSRADAGMISYGVGYDTHTQSGMVTLFDPSLGPLREVSFWGGASVSQTFHYQDPISDMAFRGSVGIVMIRSDDHPGAWSLAGGSFTGSVHLDPPTTGVTISGGAMFGFDSTTGLDIFEGTGMANVQMTGFLAPTQLPPPTIAEPAFGSGSGVITYLYGAPEPSSWVMGLIAVVALGGVKIRHLIRKPKIRC
jgi:hypothetical protein